MLIGVWLFMAAGASTIGYVIFLTAMLVGLGAIAGGKTTLEALDGFRQWLQIFLEYSVLVFFSVEATFAAFATEVGPTAGHWFAITFDMFEAVGIKENELEFVG